MSREQIIGRWLLTGCVLIAAMVVVGGITRLTHSGLSMVEWNLVLGSLPPLTQAQWQEPFLKYQQSPEFKLLNAHFTLQEFKQIYWWEYIHRFLGRSMGLVFLLPFVFFWAKGWLTGLWKKRLLVLLLLGAFQGVLGWYMVKSGLVKNPFVSHYRLAAHLLSAFGLFGYTWWLVLAAREPQRKKTPAGIQNLPQWLSPALLALVALQVVYGAFVAGLKAGFVFNTFPLMGNSLMAPQVWALQPWWHNLLESGAGVQFVHRCLAFAVLGSVLWLVWQTRRRHLAAGVRQSVQALVLAVLVQFGLGVATLLLAVPVWLGVAHQLGALLVVAAGVQLLYYNRLPQAMERKKAAPGTARQQVLQSR